jgi:EmrB/QacA subfamily drug resistance transporter
MTAVRPPPAGPAYRVQAQAPPPDAGLRLIPGDRPAGPGPGAPAVRVGAVLAICCGSLFMVGLDVTAANVALPTLARNMHAGVSGLQWAVTGYTIALACLLMSAGAVADRVGRKAVFTAGLAVFTAGSWLCSVAPGIGWLVAFRALQGAGGAAMNPAAMGIIQHTFRGSPARRVRAVGAWESTLGLAMALGPLLGGVLVSRTGWRSVFWINIPVGLLLVCLVTVAVPDSRAVPARRPDPAGQALVTVLLGGVSWAIIQGPAFGWTSPAILLPAAAAAAAAAGLAAWEPRQAEPLIDTAAFRSKPLSGASAAAAAVMCAQAAFLFVATLDLQDVRGLSAIRAGVAILPMPAALAAFSRLSGRLVARYGGRPPVVAGGLAITGACVLLSQLTNDPAQWPLSVSFALFGAGIGLANPGITHGIISALPPGRASSGAAMNASFRQAGQSLGVAVGGSLLADALRGSTVGMSAGLLPAWIAAGGCGVLMAALGLTFPRGPARPGRPAGRAVILPAVRRPKGRHRRSGRLPRRA